MPRISGLEAPSSSSGGSLAGCTGAGASDQVRLEVVRGIKVVRCKCFKIYTWEYQIIIHGI